MRGVGRGIMRGAGAPKNTWFTPRSIPNLTSWWDFADESTVTETGGNVEQINDKSGNGYSVSQATAADRPAYNSKAAGIAGHRTAEFTDAGNEHLDVGGPTVANLLDPSGTDGYTLIACFDYKTLTPDATVLTFSGDQFAILEIGTNFRWRIAGVDRTFPTSATGLQLQICTYDGALTGGTATQRINGTDTNGTADRGGTDTGTLSLGDSGFSQDMELAEVISYDRELTAAEIAQIEGYFTGKWGAP